MQNSTIHIALTLTDSFWALAYAAARSISVTSRRPDLLHFHIVHEGLQADHHEVLASLATEFGVQLSYYDISDNADVADMSRTLRNTKRYPKIVYSRLLLDRILPPDIERVLYLDSDILVLGDLTELFNTDLEGHSLGAVGDILALFQRLGHDLRARREFSTPGEQWFNGGVLLWDLRKCAAADIPGYAHELPTRMDISRLFFDQDLANMKFANQWKPLNWRYNVMAPKAGHQSQSPVIIHFTNKKKPWESLYRGVYSRVYRHAMTNKVFYWQVRERWQKVWWKRLMIPLLPRG